MTQPTIAVANYFIGKAQEEGVEITPMKLLKLVYIAHGWSYPAGIGPLIGEEVQAWKFGPVIPSVYHRFKEYGASNITQQAAEWTDDNKLVVPAITENSPESKLLDSVWHAYKQFNGGQLSTLTHKTGSPWQQTVAARDGVISAGMSIPNAIIEQHYRQIAAKRSAKLTHYRMF